MCDDCSGQRILNTIILNHKENSAKPNAYINKPPGWSPLPAFRASGRVVPAGCMGRVHDSPIVYSLLREGSHPPHPLTAERGGAIFGTCLWGYVIARAVDLGQGGGCWCLMLRWLFGTEDFEYYNTQPQRK